jgi:segregation and condensation protein A
LTEYRVQLDVFTGPLDLLLYLIRRDELDIQDIPIARLTEQYLAYVRLLEHIDPNIAGEFLVMASTLLELKSRSLLPSPPLEALEGEIEDPRSTLVRQLLEYKRFKDAAGALGSAADERAKRYVRRPVDLPPELQGVELEEVQVWDLLEAFSVVMTAIGQGPGKHEVRYDDTPIELCAAELVAVLEQEGPATFQSLFEGQTDRAAVIGRFLALLELIRSHRIRAEQDRNFGTIYLFLLDEVEEAEADSVPVVGEMEHSGEPEALDQVEDSPAPLAGEPPLPDVPAEAPADEEPLPEVSPEPLIAEEPVPEVSPELPAPAETAVLDSSEDLHEQAE